MTHHSPTRRSSVWSFRRGAPKSAREILNRVNEITVTSSLLREVRAIDFVSRLIDEGKLDRETYKQVLVHRISAEEHINPLGASSKMNAEWAFLQHLFDIGWRATDDWLAANFEHLGKRSTIDTRAMRSEEHTSELQSLMRISYAVFCLKKKKNKRVSTTHNKN